MRGRRPLEKGHAQARGKGAPGPDPRALREAVPERQQPRGRGPRRVGLTWPRALPPRAQERLRGTGSAQDTGCSEAERGTLVPGKRALLFTLGRLQHLSRAMPRVHTRVCGSAGNAGHGSLLLGTCAGRTPSPWRPREWFCPREAAPSRRVGGPRPADSGRRLRVTRALDQGGTRWAAWPLSQMQHWPPGCIPAHPRTGQAQATGSIAARRLCCADQAQSSERRRLCRIPPAGRRMARDSKAVGGGPAPCQSSTVVMSRSGEEPAPPRAPEPGLSARSPLSLSIPWRGWGCGSRGCAAEAISFAHPGSSPTTPLRAQRAPWTAVTAPALSPWGPSSPWDLGLGKSPHLYVSEARPGPSPSAVALRTVCGEYKP